MAELEKLKKYLHLPVQSGADRILELMNRGYTREFYLSLCQEYRRVVRGGVLTTDIIVGFPTETTADFEDTYNLVESVAFEAAFIFKYSPRPHTGAEKLNDDVAKSEKEARHRMILDLQKNISAQKKLEPISRTDA
jgi:tRNA-2-methylthio-N6-dimethylallyladenosine synthase